MNVKAWIGDSCRFAWGLFYWNARKSWYRLRKQRGACPCQHPSDSGRGGETGCEAVVHWERPARFKGVCPLLVQGKDRRWVCSVNAKDVRPFWGRAFKYFGGTAMAVAVLAFVFVFSLMRVIGYEVSPRQLIWPPAWGELRAVRAKLFIKQAQAYYDKGQLRDAVRALSVGYQYDPSNYTAGRTLARFYEAASPSAADDLYARLMLEHPDKGVETAQVWMRSLLTRERFEALAALARRQISADRGSAAVWTNALIFSALRAKHPEWLEEASRDAADPEPVRQLLALAARLTKASPGETVGLLQLTVSEQVFPYGLIFRAEQLIERGFPKEALALIAEHRGQIGGRDEAGLILSGIAKLGDDARLEREFDGLLAPTRKLTTAEFSLLSLHLIRYPNPRLAAKLVNNMARLGMESPEPQIEALITLFCALGVQQDKAGMAQVKTRLAEVAQQSLPFVDNLQEFFLDRSPRKNIGTVLPRLSPMPLDLLYALLGKYLSQ